MMKYIFILFLILGCNKVDLSRNEIPSILPDDNSSEENGDDDDLNRGEICDEEPGLDEFQDGDGSLLWPYLICTVEHLNNVRDFPNAYFQLESDIDLEDETFLPIAEFNSTFNGQGYRILNWTHSDNSEQAALFIQTSSSTNILNLHLKNISLTGTNVGGLVGELHGLINGCSVQGDLQGTFGIGGIAGSSNGGESMIANSFFYGSLTATGDASIFGVPGVVALGGIVALTMDEILIENSYAFVTSFTYDNTLGSPGHGLCGGAGFFCVGEIVGMGGQLTLNHVYYQDHASAIDSFANAEGATSLNLVQLANSNSFSSWDFTNIWTMGTGDYSFPILNINTDEIVLGNFGLANECIPDHADFAFDGGDGGLTTPYLVANRTQLAKIDLCYRNKFFKQTADITNLDVNFFIRKAPRGYNGDYFAISTWTFNDNWDADTYPYLGFFNELPSGSSITNVRLTVGSIIPGVTTGDLDALGGLVGRMGEDANLWDVNVTITDEIRNDADNIHIGGMVGKMDGGTINNSNLIMLSGSKLTSTGANVQLGGLVGSATGESFITSVAASINDGALITASGQESDVGGFIGTLDTDARITNSGVALNGDLETTGAGGFQDAGGFAAQSYGTIIGSTIGIGVTGSVYATSSAGGFIGTTYSSSVTNGSVMLLGFIDGQNAGGLIGNFDGTASGGVTIAGGGILESTSGSATIGGFIGSTHTGSIINGAPGDVIVNGIIRYATGGAAMGWYIGNNNSSSTTINGGASAVDGGTANVTNGGIPLSVTTQIGVP